MRGEDVSVSVRVRVSASVSVSMALHKCIPITCVCVSQEKGGKEERGGGKGHLIHANCLVVPPHAARVVRRLDQVPGFGVRDVLHNGK